ncbi:hypothetical protein DRW03_32445 [Corallococcus sp. H22C18031201]|nr:hypothetical protein DRW03_32445 [Corallococcus sp. H22C18031201]
MSFRRLVFPSCLLLSCLWTSSCGSSGVSYASDYGSEGGAPTTPTVAADKLVRPDLLTLRFSVRQESEVAAQALPALKAVVDKLVRASAEATHAEVAPRMKTFGTETGSSRKLSSDSDKSAVAVHGVLEVAMPATMDFWGRSELMARLIQVAKTTAAESEKQGVRLYFSAPEPSLRDADAHRADLLRRWVERTRSFTLSAQSEAAPMGPVECSTPEAVQQRPVSLEEVALTLPVSCRLAVLPAASAPKLAGGAVK